MASLTNGVRPLNSVVRPHVANRAAMRKALEFIRAVIVVSAVPVVLTFYATTSRTLYLVLFVYVVVATLAVVVLNQVLHRRDDANGSPTQPSSNDRHGP